jgi:hypothetical protein
LLIFLFFSSLLYVRFFPNAINKYSKTCIYNNIKKHCHALTKTMSQ